MMMMVAAGFLVVAGAFAQNIETEFDRNADFTKYRTFAIRDGRLNSANPSLNSELVRKRLEDDIQKFLTAKGLALVATGPSDLNVRYTLGVARGVEAEAYPAGWYGLRTRVVRVPYTEGTLVIDLRDAGTRSLLWRAIARCGARGSEARRQGEQVDRQVPTEEITSQPAFAARFSYIVTEGRRRRRS